MVFIPYGAEFHALFDIFHNGGNIFNLLGCASVSSCGVHCLGEYCFVKLLCSCKDVGILKISGTGVKHAATEDGFHLFCHYGFDVVCPQTIGFFVIKISEKGNCYDNCIMEIFFGRLKNEMFYGFEKEYTSFESFASAIAEYIDYYNNRRIQAKTKWMPPSKFREASMMIS